MEIPKNLDNEVKKLVADENNIEKVKQGLAELVGKAVTLEIRGFSTFVQPWKIGEEKSDGFDNGGWKDGMEGELEGPDSTSNENSDNIYRVSVAQLGYEQEISIFFKFKYSDVAEIDIGNSIIKMKG